MRLDDQRPSDNIEDRRGQDRFPGRGGIGFPMGGGIRFPIGRRGGGLGIGAVLALLAISLIFGVDPIKLISGSGLAPQQIDVPNHPPARPAASDSDPMRDFTAKILATTEETWARIFQENSLAYGPPRLVLFTGVVQSACGTAQSAMGPFYCSLDRRVYIDMSFYGDMDRRLGATGDFARAYVIAHEVGHHVQNLLGIAGEIAQARSRTSPVESNALSVRMELQADCLAGVWARDNIRILEQGDIEEGLNAASAIGDDRLQKRAQGYVVPDSFTHGSSQQRVSWFKRGFEVGSMATCNTFDR